MPAHRAPSTNLLRHLRHRLYSTSPPPGPHTTSSTPPTPSHLTRLQSRLPPRLRPYLNPLLSAPVSHITSFLVLHELTAIVPLVGLFALFHYGAAQDVGWLARWRARVEGTAAFREGVGRWERYARRKGWIHEQEVVGDGAESARAYAQGEAVTSGTEGRAGDLEREIERTGTQSVDGQGLERAGSGSRIVIELAAAWAVTKVLLPARLAVSVWATPWFARAAVVPITAMARRLVGR